MIELFSENFHLLSVCFLTIIILLFNYIWPLIKLNKIKKNLKKIETT